MNLIILLVFFLGSTEIAANQRFFDYLEGVESLESDFLQETLSDEGVVLETSRGYLKIKKPGMFKLLYSSPFIQEIISNGDRIWIYDPDLQQVVVRETFDSEVSFLNLILKNPIALEENYIVKSLTEGNGLNEKFLLVASEGSSTVFRRVYVSFSNELISGFQLKAGVDRILEIRLNNVKKNTEIDAREFEFIPPENADVINGVSR